MSDTKTDRGAGAPNVLTYELDEAVTKPAHPSLLRPIVEQNIPAGVKAAPSIEVRV